MKKGVLTELDDDVGGGGTFGRQGRQVVEGRRGTKRRRKLQRAGQPGSNKAGMGWTHTHGPATSETM